MSSTTFKVGDKVRRTKPGDYFGANETTVLEVDEVGNGSVRTIGVNEEFRLLWHSPEDLEIVDGEPRTEHPRVTVEGVITIIEHARLIERAIEAVKEVGVDDSVMVGTHPEDSLSEVLDLLHRRIGKLMVESGVARADA